MKTITIRDLRQRWTKAEKALESEHEITITRDGKPAGVLIGFGSEDDWLDYRLENDPRFLRRIEQARKSLREGHGVKIEDVE